MSQNGNSSPTAEGSNRGRARRLLPPVPKEIFRDFKSGAQKFKDFYPSLPLVLSQAKNTNFNDVHKAFEDRRAKYGTSIDFDYRQDILEKVPACVVAAASRRDDSSPQGPPPTWYTLYDPGQLGGGAITGIVQTESRSHADTLLARGYIEIPSKQVFSASANEADLPFPQESAGGDDEEAADAASTVAPLHSRLPPEEARTPPTLPLLRTQGPNTGLRDLLVECFEVKVVDEANGVVWPPIRLWKAIPPKAGDSLNARLRAYYAVKKGLPGTTMSQLKAAASKDSSIMERKAELKREKKNFVWLDYCVDLYNKSSS